MSYQIEWDTVIHIFNQDDIFRSTCVFAYHYARRITNGSISIQDMDLEAFKADLVAYCDFDEDLHVLRYTIRHGEFTSYRIVRDEADFHRAFRALDAQELVFEMVSIEDMNIDYFMEILSHQGHMFDHATFEE
ncbi:hypothetical protein BDV28DRAFT_146968 [Aspergillus coremiiformis]|uniref:Uncharacterized protein n=1 Tax=Aspergillus coremiiformis TaxID=138285 RepID=A0A5N6ZAB0_9EURO|nr:hypothetical protein BDV28DRAFT_146968 [Aspergillus coremiiformis]